MTVHAFGDKVPRFGPDAFVHVDATVVGDEGGFAPAIGTAREALDVIVEAIGKAGYKAGEEILISLDPAASEYSESQSRPKRSAVLLTGFP